MFEWRMVFFWQMHTLPNGDAMAVMSKAEAEFQYRKMFQEGEYGHVLEFSSGCNVVDVGGNIGIFSKYAHHRQPDCKVFAFEPIPQLFQCMAKNANKTDVLARKAVGDGQGGREVMMEYLPEYTMLSGLSAQNNKSLYYEAAISDTTKSKVDRAFRGAETVTAPTTTLAHELKDVGVVHIVKIDVEGMEAQVLAGIDEELWSRIQQIAIEVHDYDDRIKEVADDLLAKGFVTTVTKPRPPSFVIGDQVGSWQRGSGLGTSLVYGTRPR